MYNILNALRGTRRSGNANPEANTWVISNFTFAWLDPLLRKGYSKTLEQEDLWEVPPECDSTKLSEDIEEKFADWLFANGLGSREDPDADAAAGPSELKAGPIRLGEDTAPAKTHPSLFVILYSVHCWQWWILGVVKGFADALNTTAPIITRLLLAWLTICFQGNRGMWWQWWYRRGHPWWGPVRVDIGYGIGLSFAMFAMHQISSLLTNHVTYTMNKTGFSIRTALTRTIFRKSMRLTPSARREYGAEHIRGMLSSEVMAVERAFVLANELYTAPIQIMIATGLLFWNFGVSGLIGVGILAVGIPVQFGLAVAIKRLHQKAHHMAMKRTSYAAGIKQNLCTITAYAWERVFESKIVTMRAEELESLRFLTFSRAFLTALLSIIPLLAAMVSIIVYRCKMTREFNMAAVISSLQLLNVVRVSMYSLPLCAGTVINAIRALRRISRFLAAEEVYVTSVTGLSSDVDININGSFSWNFKPSTPQQPSVLPPSVVSRRRGWKFWSWRPRNYSELPTSNTMVPSAVESQSDVSLQESPAQFELKNINIRIPKGSFVAIVGSTGSGRTSLLKAITGEMRKTRGELSVSPSVAFVPQDPWILDTTIRENITFGQPIDDLKLLEAIHACGLESEFDSLPHGVDTEISKNSTHLTNEQKAWISLARATYSGNNIILVDDILSTINLDTKKAILDKVLNGALASKTRVVVTADPLVLRHATRIYVVDNGSIVEEGSFTDLERTGKLFSHLLADVSRSESKGKQRLHERHEEASAPVQGAEPVQDDAEKVSSLDYEQPRVSTRTYVRYLKFIGDRRWLVLLPLLLFITQGTQIGNIIIVSVWSLDDPWSNGFLVGYIILGVANVIFSLVLAMAISFVTRKATLRLFSAAIRAFFWASQSSVDVHSKGSAIVKLSTAQSGVDVDMPMNALQLLRTLGLIASAVIMSIFGNPVMATVLIPLGVAYYFTAKIYSRTAVSVRSLDVSAQSSLQSYYTEVLERQSELQGCGSPEWFASVSEKKLEKANRAYYVYMALQPWLNLRIGLVSNVLVLALTLLSCAFRFVFKASNVGVALFYTMNLTQVILQLLNTHSINRQNFEAVQLMLQVADMTPDDEDIQIEGDLIGPSWPEEGKIIFEDVELRCNDEIVRGINFTVQPGQKIAVVGKSINGNTALIRALFRSVNVTHGKIEIDGWNIERVRSAILRRRLTVVSQDDGLFEGTLRENLDPLSTLTDVDLIIALQKVHLLPRAGFCDLEVARRFDLNAVVHAAGSDYNAEEHQLLALSRALIKGDRIVILEDRDDVGSASNAKIQEVIQTEFKPFTLLHITHRPENIAQYDRVLLIEDGGAKFDTPLNLFDNGANWFRTLCEIEGLTRQDIVGIHDKAHRSTTVSPDAQLVHL